MSRGYNTIPSTFANKQRADACHTTPLRGFYSIEPPRFPPLFIGKFMAVAVSITTSLQSCNSIPHTDTYLLRVLFTDAQPTCPGQLRLLSTTASRFNGTLQGICYHTFIFDAQTVKF